MEHALSLAARAQEMATIAERKTRAQDQQQHTSHLQRLARGCDLIATMLKPVPNVVWGDGGKRLH